MAAKVDLKSFISQKQDLNTGFMTLGKWFASHPPLVDRIAVLEPLLMQNVNLSSRGARSAISIVILTILVPILVIVTGVNKFSKIIKNLSHISQYDKAKAYPTYDYNDSNYTHPLSNDSNYSSPLPDDSSYSVPASGERTGPNLDSIMKR